MKLSKKHPALKSLIDLRKSGRTINNLRSAIPEVVARGKDRELYSALVEGSRFALNCCRQFGFARWFEPCKSLLSDAFESYPKLRGLKIDKGIYIITGLGISSYASEVAKNYTVVAVAIVDDNGNIELGAFAGPSSIPHLVLEKTHGVEKFTYTHSDGLQSSINKKNRECSDILKRTAAVLLFAQHAGEEAKQMMSAPVPRKMNCIRPDRNDLGIKRIRLTASWYRDTVLGHPFMVRGHWRMQRHGKGLKEVTPKFIAPHMKNGYRSKPQRDNVD